MKAEDNKFPYVTIEEATTPATPDAGTQRLFIDVADSLPKLVDASDVVVGLGGGGSRIYPIPFAFDSPNIGTTGFQVFVPTPDDVLLNGWIVITTPWLDSNNPGNLNLFADYGQFSAGDTEGYGSIVAQAVDTGETAAAAVARVTGSGGLQMLGFQQFDLASAAYFDQTSVTVVPSRFQTADPIELVVTDTGLPGGDPKTPTQGEGVLYLMVQTPVAP